jgi:hypothetical protein
MGKNVSEIKHILTLYCYVYYSDLYSKINIISHVFHDKIKVLYIQYNTSLKVTVTILLNLNFNIAIS